MSPAELKSWQALTRLASEHIQQTPAADLDLRFEVAGILVELSKHRLDENLLSHLLELADDCRLQCRIEDLFTGVQVNTTEGQPALHTALRARPEEVPGIARSASSVIDRMLSLAESVRNGDWLGYTGRTITDVVHIGIGGSHLGPELAVEALSRSGQHGPRLHFVANVDHDALASALRGLDPERTLFIVASKSFSTPETTVNARSARSWLLERTIDLGAIPKHFLAITTNLKAAQTFGIPPANVFEMWDWVGGRYSIWSPVGLPLALAISPDGFREFLRGASEIDHHFRTTPFPSNLPVLMALVGIWNYNFLGATNQVILPYAERLRLLPDYLQQLSMESNGKSVDLDGNAVGIHTMPIVWGGRGTNGQHAFHQLLHQGTRSFAADFIVVADSTGPSDHHRWLLANALAQSQAMLLGQEDTNPHKQVPGNKGTTTIVLNTLSPATLGALLALYEHVVFCQGVIWNINSFDQWGVELGKRLAVPIYDQLDGKSALYQDLSTRSLIDHLIRHSGAMRSTEDE